MIMTNIDRRIAHYLSENMLQRGNCLVTYDGYGQYMGSILLSENVQEALHCFTQLIGSQYGIKFIEFAGSQEIEEELETVCALLDVEMLGYSDVLDESVPDLDPLSWDQETVKDYKEKHHSLYIAEQRAYYKKLFEGIADEDPGDHFILEEADRMFDVTALANHESHEDKHFRKYINVLRETQKMDTYFIGYDEDDEETMIIRLMGTVAKGCNRETYNHLMAFLALYTPAKKIRIINFKRHYVSALPEKYGGIAPLINAGRMYDLDKELLEFVNVTDFDVSYFSKLEEKNKRVLKGSLGVNRLEYLFHYDKELYRFVAQFFHF